MSLPHGETSATMSERVGPLLDRRGFFSWSLQGLGATALISLLAREGLIRAGEGTGAERVGGLPKPHFAPKARRAVQITLVGGMSHLDSFDYKPELQRFHGKTLKTETPPDIFFGQVGLIRKNDWEFRRRGRSGQWISGLFPELAGVADELTVLRSMTADSANHTPALFVLNSGFQFNGYPAMGSWLSFGLGSEADDLPSYVVLPDGRGEPNGAASNWTNGFLPAQHQGVVFRGGSPEPVRDLFAARRVDPAAERAARAFLNEANSAHLAQSGEEEILKARIRSYELAARMQLAVPEVADLDREPESIRELYGLSRPETADCGRRCLLARRLLERGVRFVQVYSGGPIAGSPRVSWDAHENVRENHGAEAAEDRPAGGRAGPRPEAAGDARGHARDLHHRVRPHPLRPVGRQRRRARPRPQPLRLLLLARRRRPQAGHLPRRDRRDRLESRRTPCVMARFPRHRITPAGHRPRAIDVLS